MRIAVLGATGGTGREFVRQALAEGHELCALVRRHGSLAPAPGLEIVEGDALAEAAVADTVRGADAVACFLGVPKPDGTVVSDATRALCDAMNANGVKRLVAVTVMGAGDSRGSFSRLGGLFVRLFLSKALVDRERQEDVIASSGLDYTVVRPSRLVDGAATGRYSAGPDVRAGLASKLTRGDLAAHVLRLVQVPGTAQRHVSIVGD